MLWGNGWIVVRGEGYADDRFWVCLDKDDALAIAQDVVDYWMDQHKPDPERVHVELPGDNTIFSVAVEDAFYVYVIPTKIREKGDRRPDR
jgi:hypothetical protein